MLSEKIPMRAHAGSLLAGSAAMLLWASLPCTAAAPPEFALSGLAPDDTNVLILMKPGTHEDVAWTEVLGEFVGSTIGKDAIGQWQRVKAFCAELAGPEEQRPSPTSMISIRFGHPAVPIDWVLATRMNNPEICAEGLRSAGARVLGGGSFALPDAELELRSCGQWLLASPLESPLATEVKERAQVNAILTTDPKVLDAINPLPRGALEVVVRHGPPASGVTAAAFKPVSALEANVAINGCYESSPLPSRTPSTMDLRMLPRLANRAALVIRESGIGLLDPFVMRFGVVSPAIIPPVEVRRNLGLERLLVLDGETVKIKDQTVMEVPVACVAVPICSEGANDSDDIKASVDSWMQDVGDSLGGLINKDQAVAPPAVVDGNVQHVDFGPELVRMLDDHPVGYATSLNWMTCSEESGRQWLLISTSPTLAQRVGTALKSLPETENSEDMTSTVGVVSPEALAAQVNDLSAIRLSQGDVDSKSDARLLSSIATILAGLERVEWQFTRQDENRIEGNVNVFLPAPRSAEEEVSP